jgi:flagellar operon protein
VQSPRGAASPVTNAAGQSFAQVLRQEQQRSAPDALKLSGHAQARLQSRGIALSADDVTRIGQGVDKVAGKGGRESLVLMDDLALVVSVRNRTVITVMDGESRKGNVFTQIDSAVIV